MSEIENHEDNRSFQEKLRHPFPELRQQLKGIAQLQAPGKADD